MVDAPLLAEEGIKWGLTKAGDTSTRRIMNNGSESKIAFVQFKSQGCLARACQCTAPEPGGKCLKTGGLPPALSSPQTPLH
mmetsp:Transcript_93474/g.157119  ORF Transcript_93474/g.157119 Transcript_93474/m.157119 type:complete len:81 (-) Transcript_93474:144-386(-)